jgi:microcystin-dependent protein
LSEFFIGEIRVFPYGYEPRSWIYCDGRVIPIQQNSALYSLLGIKYGGDGKTNFGIPDLRSKCAVGYGAGTGLTNRKMGDKGGDTTITLQANQIPVHAHSLGSSAVVTLKCSSADATDPTPVGNTIAPNAVTVTGNRFNTEVPGASMKDGAIELAGNVEASGSPGTHENMQPSIVVGYYIATTGYYPQRP